MASDCFTPCRSGIAIGCGPLLICSVSSSVTRTFAPALGRVPTAWPLSIASLYTFLRTMFVNPAWASFWRASSASMPRTLGTCWIGGPVDG